MKRFLRIVGVFVAVVAFISIIVIILIQLTPRPPLSEMEEARQSIAAATRNKADTYSKKLFNESKALYDSAMTNWKKQNNRFIYFRDYDKVLTFANQAASKAKQASESSVKNSSGLKKKIGQKIDSLNNLVTKIDKFFTTYPLPSETRNRISKGKMILEEAELNYSKGHYLQANRQITDSEYMLTTSYNNASENLRNYFKSFSTWKSWVDRTIKNSGVNGNYAFIVDKFSRKLYVYRDGVKKQEFVVELGKNWVGDKLEKGDDRTPEGMYKITRKIDSRNTKYYKALLLDYPNAEDVARFKAEKARGSLPSSAKIGGLIEIHGNGGKGVDWTEGCVALTDREMDQVFRMANAGTPVTIVGSTIDLPEILKK
jgi:hypothetical protein